MDFALGYISGVIVMWAASRMLKAQWKRDLEKLEDFDTWKEWKNRKKN